MFGVHVHASENLASSASCFSPTLHTQRGGAESKRKRPGARDGSRASGMTPKVYPPAERFKTPKERGREQPTLREREMTPGPQRDNYPRLSVGKAKGGEREKPSVLDNIPAQAL